MATHRPTTPLRRISRGSISALSNSRGAASSSSSTPLSFLESSLGTLSDETTSLSSNLSELANIYDALNQFNEGFGMLLYGLKVAAYCIEWSEAPQEENFARAKERQGSYRDGRLDVAVGVPPSPYQAHNAAADQTYMTTDDSFEAPPAASSRKAPVTTSTVKPGLKSALKKPTASVAKSKTATTTPAAATAPAAGGVKKITLAQKKKREKYAEEIIETLPLEYRGGDPTNRRLASAVLMALIAAGTKGLRVADIAKSPELPQVKVNKCLIALMAAKQTIKKSASGGTLYLLDPSKHDVLP